MGGSRGGGWAVGGVGVRRVCLRVERDKKKKGLGGA